MSIEIRDAFRTLLDSITNSSVITSEQVAHYRVLLSELEDCDPVLTRGTTVVVEAWNALPNDLRLSPHMTRLFEAIKTCRDVDEPMYRVLATNTEQSA